MDEMAISDGVLLNATVILPQSFSLTSSDPPLMKGFPNYIVSSNPFPSSTCLPSHPAPKYPSYLSSLSGFL